MYFKYFYKLVYFPMSLGRPYSGVHDTPEEHSASLGRGDGIKMSLEEKTMEL